MVVPEAVLVAGRVKLDATYDPGLHRQVTLRAHPLKHLAAVARISERELAGSLSGRDAIEKMLRDNLIVYDDGTPRTKHLTTNVAIEVDEEAGTAVSRSYFTALQALPDLALQPIVSGRYHDHFERRDEQWRFVERRVRTDLVGDLSRHLRHAAAER